MRMSDWSSDVCSSDLPAADCPTGFTNAGVIANLRNCSITGRINNDLNIPKRAGTIYSLVGRVDVGTDVGGDGAAVGGKGVTLSVDPGVAVFGSGDRKSTRRTPVTNVHLVCRLLLEKKK